VTQANGSLYNPQSGRCLDDPSGITTNGEQLQVWDCNNLSPQVFSVNGGGPIIGPGASAWTPTGTTPAATARPSNCGTGTGTTRTSTGTTTRTGR